MTPDEIDNNRLAITAGMTADTLAVIILPINCDGTMTHIAKAFPGSYVRGGGSVMFIDRPARKPKREREKLDIIPGHPYVADGTLGMGDCATCGRARTDSIHKACTNCGFSAEGCDVCNQHGVVVTRKPDVAL